MKKILYNISWNIKCFFDPVVQGIKNIIFFFFIIWNDRDWGCSYMLKLEKRKLEKMIKWYEKNNYGHLVHGKRIYNQLCLAVNILKIILEEDTSYYTFEVKQKAVGISPEEDFLTYIQGFHGFWTLNRHINCNNRNRFMNIPDYIWYNNPEMHAVELYKAKAWNLYHKIRELYMDHWWD